MVDTQELKKKLNNYLEYKKRWESEAIEYPQVNKFLTEEELANLAESLSLQLAEVKEAFSSLYYCADKVVRFNGEQRTVTDLTRPLYEFKGMYDKINQDFSTLQRKES